MGKLKNGRNIKCAVCGKIRYIVPSQEKQGRGKFCSKKCMYENQTGRQAWNAGKTGIYSYETRKKISESLKKLYKDKTKHPRWKGNNVGYFALHDWVEKVLGKPSECGKCRTTEKRVYHWANLSGEYKRDENDWMRMCVPCHRKYDYAREKQIST